MIKNIAWKALFGLGLTLRILSTPLINLALVVGGFAGLAFFCAADLACAG